MTSRQIEIALLIINKKNPYVKRIINNHLQIHYANGDVKIYPNKYYDSFTRRTIGGIKDIIKFIEHNKRYLEKNNNTI